MTKNIILKFNCNGRKCTMNPNNDINTIPKKLQPYFGYECQCHLIPKKYEKHSYQDYDENRTYIINWTLKTGVRFSM